MDPFKMGLRNLIGITAPGAILLLALGYCLVCVALVLDISWALPGQLKDAQWLGIVGGFVVSYLVGSVFRLNAADDLDAISSCAMETDLNRKGTIDSQEWQELRRNILEGRREYDALLNDPRKLPPGFDLWLCATEPFPYPASALRKFGLYHLPQRIQIEEPFQHRTVCLEPANFLGSR